MNNDLISREALKEVLKELLKTEPSSLYGCGLRLAIEKIDSAPTVNFIISPDYVTELQNINKELIKQLEESVSSQGEWIDYDNTFYKCPDCGYLLGKYCPQCQNKVILPKGGAE